MMRRDKFFAVCLTAALGMSFSGGAHAALMIKDGQGGTIPNSNQEPNDVFGTESANDPRGYGANLYYDGFTKLRFTFVGKEAGYNNEFQVDGNPIFTTNGSSFGASFDFDIGSGSADGASDGTIPFTFVNNVGGSVTNVSNRNDISGGAGGMNFFVTSPVATTLDNSDTWKSLTGTFLALDDNGANNDDNHDDMGIQVEVLTGTAEVPVPSTLALLGSVLIGLGLFGRKRT